MPIFVPLAMVLDMHLNVTIIYNLWPSDMICFDIGQLLVFIDGAGAIGLGHLTWARRPIEKFHIWPPNSLNYSIDVGT